MSETSDNEQGKLDVLSESFDALTALYSKNEVVPWKKAPTFDNLAKYESLANQSDGSASLDKVLSKKEQEKSTKIATEVIEPIQRKIILKNVKPPENTDEEDDEPRRGPPKKTYENVFSLIEKAVGPLGFLKNCMQHRVRVKVWTRSRANIRGYSQGFVVAFDKHWNLAMEDVTEIWTRQIKRKTVPLGIPNELPSHWKIQGPPHLPPPIVIVKKDRKSETCSRHLNQVMIRGEHVVMISVTSS